MAQHSQRSIATQLAPDEPLDLTEYYFERVNHVFPIVNRELLMKNLFDRALRPASNQDEAHARDMDFSHIAKAGSIALAAHLRDLDEPLADAARSGSKRAQEFLDATRAHVGDLVMAEPLVSSVQALLMLCVIMLDIPKQLDAAAALLAVAVRQAQSLRLHVLNQVEGLSPLERLAQIRLFWCVYIIDQDLSLRTRTPPLIDDRDL
ncbi:hypothetical protein LTR95_017437, partial [Oleoguttula sp. CCFEE 5521]